MQYTSGKDFLTKLAEVQQITPDGKEWLTLALDPFHDYNHQVAGYPDADCSQTTVSCYQYQSNLVAPAGVPGTWDAHVYNMPICKPDSFGVYDMPNTWTSIVEPAVIINTCSTGPLTIVTNAAGSPLGNVIPMSATADKSTLPAAVDNYDLCSGITRVIGMGFEITNTTAEIYKQGTITAYRMPQMGSNYQIVARNNPLTFVAPIAGQMWREPPSTPAEANLLKGTRTWAAGEGVYATCFQNSVHNPLAQVESAQVLMQPAASPGVASVVRASQWYTIGAGAAAPAASAVAFAPQQTMPFDTTGVFLTGLSNATTLTVKLRVYVERAPTYSEPSLAVLASPSAGYDVKVLELYAAAINMLPVAVKVGENAKGDWWRAVLGVLKAAAGPIGMALNPFLPGASLLGAGIQAVSGQINTSKGRSISDESLKKLNMQMMALSEKVRQKPQPPRNPAQKKKPVNRKK